MAYSATAFQATDMIQGALRKLGQLKTYIATGGTATTAVIGELAGKTSHDIGTLFVIRDAGGASAAPEGKWSRISGYTKSTGTFTIDSIDAVAAGDVIGIASNLFSLYDLIELSNDALREIGPIVSVDTTTLDSAADKTEYAQSIQMKYGIIRVDLQTKSDADDNQWRTIWNIEEIPAAPGSAGTFEIPQLESGWDLRILYKGEHPKLTAYDSYIMETIPPRVAVWQLVVEMCLSQWNLTEDEKWAEELTSARNELRLAKAETVSRKPRRRNRMRFYPKS